ncbi:hypothetical protein ACHAWF_000859, partial [Thalassiosira exigua]
MNQNRTGAKPLAPLSDLAARSDFDSPRIYLGRRKKRTGFAYVPLRLGPRSSVVLDTTYLDDKVGMGRGGSSGARFVFQKVGEEEKVEEAKEYRVLLRQRGYTRKGKALRRSGLAATAGAYVALGSKGAGQLGAIAARSTSRLFSSANLPFSPSGRDPGRREVGKPRGARRRRRPRRCFRESSCCSSRFRREGSSENGFQLRAQNHSFHWNGSGVRVGGSGRRLLKRPGTC